MQLSPRLGRLIAALLLAALGISLVVAISRKTVTNDEMIHIPAGYYYWTFGDFALNAEHPPLVKLWAALPLLVLTTPDPEPPRSAAVSDRFTFFSGFWLKRIHDFKTLAFWPRVMMIPFALALGALIYAYARKLFGVTAGLIALVLYCVEPTFLAHGRIVHTDVPGTLGYLGFFFLLHRYLEKRGLQRAVHLGLGGAAALLLKFSMVVLVPVLGLVFLWDIVRAPGDQWKRALTSALVVCGIVLLAINGAYFFQHPSLNEIDRAIIAGQSSHAHTMASFVPLLSLLLPTYFPFGVYLVMAHNSFGHATSLLGMQSLNGWWYYFPAAFLLKTSIPILLVSVTGLLWGLGGAIRERSLRYLMLIGPAALYAAMAMTSHIDIGIRHFLPVFPFLIILAGGLLSEVATRWKKAGSAVAAVVLVWAVIEAARAFPSYTAYMNEFAMGQPWTYLSDSNVEWGDDVPELASYLKTRGITRIRGALMGGGSTLAYMGIDCGDLLGRPGPETDYVALGASFLNGSTIPPGGPGSGRETDEKRVNFFAAYRERTPEAVFGGSIYLYKVR